MRSNHCLGPSKGTICPYLLALDVPAVFCCYKHKTRVAVTVSSVDVIVERDYAGHPLGEMGGNIRSVFPQEASK